MSYAGVSATILGCENKSDLIKIKKSSTKTANMDIEKVYKYAIENNCEIIYPNDDLERIGKATKDGVINVFVKKYNKTLYIFTKNFKNKNTKKSNILDKSF